MFIREKHFRPTKIYVPNLYAKSNFQPPAFPEVMDFGEQLLDDLEINLFPFLKHHPSKITHRYFCKEKNLLNRFLDQNDLRLIPTDKNLGIALIKNEHYQKLAFQHLLNRNIYRRVDETKKSIYTLHYNQLVLLNREVLKCYKDIANLDIFLAQALELKVISIPKFHILAKVHKPKLAGRPIAGAVNWITTRLSTFLSYALRPAVQKKSHILRDSTQFINQIEHQAVPNGALLVSLDVESLYPNMKREIVKRSLEALSGSEYPEATVELLVSLAMFILNASYVEFGDLIFHQVEGMAMGTNAAVELANLYVDYLLENSEPFFEFRQYFKHYFRYIDDIFFVWLRGESRLRAFINKLNNLDPSLKLTWQISSESLSFLDVSVFVEDNLLKVKTFQKKMNLYLYLPFKSAHSTKVKEGFLKGELIRYVRSNSKEEDFNHIKSLFALRLQQRDYPLWFIRKCFAKVNYHDRAKYLEHKEQLEAEGSTNIFLKLPYHDVFVERNLSKSLRKLWFLLGGTQNQLRPMVVYKRNRNLSDIFTSSVFKGELMELDDESSQGGMSLLLDEGNEQDYESSSQSEIGLLLDYSADQDEQQLNSNQDTPASMVTRRGPTQ
jgi:hypothetical protein